jgi:nicotinate-nucleotide pyrophosphorylase (carboxylating)
VDILEEKSVKHIVDLALEEDLALGDPTTEMLVNEDDEGIAYLVAKGAGVLAGLNVARLVFSKVDERLDTKDIKHDGEEIQPGDRIAVVEGSIASILKAERTALNFLQRISGVATETAKYVKAISGTKATIKDTRKTTPGLRSLEKYAVTMGGGCNHRINLSDGILIKDNHLVALEYKGTELAEAVRIAKRSSGNLPVEVEVENIEQAQEGLLAGADVILLDNMSPGDMIKVVDMTQGKVKIEASGGVTLDNVCTIAETGVDFISVGAITHSAKAVDISLEMK